MANKLDASTQMRFTSRWGLLLSALGIAVGTGNIWRFPRIVAQQGNETGAGAFIIAWVIFLFLWSIPLIIAEYALGRKHRSGVIGVFVKSIGKKFAWMGAFVAFVTAAITFFYTVVVGWCIYYFFQTLTHDLPTTTDAAMSIWNNYQSGNSIYLFHFLAIAFAGFAIWKGVGRIEKINKILIPTLLVIVILSVIRAVTLPGSGEGIAYLFRPDFKQLGDPKLWLAALTQNAWDTGAGWGLFLTYAAYMKKEHGAVKNAFTTGIGNNTVSLLSGIMIFGTVFAILGSEMSMGRSDILEVMKTSGPASTGLTFIWMPQLFARMVMGHPLAILFFLGLSFAGFSSLIAMIELSARIFIDTGMSRKFSVLLVVALIYVLGIPAATNLNWLSNQDYVWGIGLMISGALMAFVVIKSGAKKLRLEIHMDVNDWKLRPWWQIVMTYFIPFAAVALLVWWFYQAATVFAPGEWYNPLNAYSIMTCIAQWGIMLVIFVLFNKKISGALVL
ncbi:MAG: sodium-dependent transporter [Bacteroidales bacterium]|nr:sodium-dependent transporter [Bacteroidales bacterium]